MEPRSDFLFAQPSFWEGTSRVFDLGNTLNEYNRSPSSEWADAVAMWMDWAVVGWSIRKAAEEFVQRVETIAT